MRRWPRSVIASALLIVAALAAHASAGSPAIGAAAPEITGGPWIGSPPLTLAALRGRVTLVEFWTYG